MNLSPPKNKVPIEIMFISILIENLNVLIIIFHYSSDKEESMISKASKTTVYAFQRLKEKNPLLLV